MTGSPESPRFSVRARLRSFRYAWDGLRAMLRTQHNTRIHAAATACVILLGLNVGLERLEWALVALAVAGVWIAEAFNTAVEAICDLVSPERHPLVRRAKDVAAAGVLVSAVAAVVVGLMVFGSRLGW